MQGASAAIVGDPTFGNNGIVTTAFGSAGDENVAMAVARQTDGKLVAAGGFNQDEFALARYNADGSLDTGFGTGGKVLTDFTPAGSTGTDQANAVAIQADGKIVAAGFARAFASSDGNNGEFALARYNADGSLDTGFGTGGKVMTEVGDFAGPAFALALQQDGKIVVAGRASSSGSGGRDFALARYNVDGSLDTTFGAGGTVLTDVGGVSQTDQANAVAIQSDGKIVAAGYSDMGSGASSSDFALARYNSDGSLDTSFGGDGKVTTPISTTADPFNDDEANALVIQPDAKLVAAGFAQMTNPTGGIWEYFALARYNADGSLDTSFDGDGKVSGIFSGPANGLALQSDGKLMVAGADIPCGFDCDFAVARLNAGGSLDAKGTTAIAPSGQVDIARAVLAQPDGKAVAAGYADMGPAAYYDYDFALLRYTLVPDRTLTVAKAGDGSGTVTSSPAGIDCGSTCSASYADGTSVTLTATASTGSSFTGWSGDCSGTGTCTLTMSANHSATATFESDRTLTVTKSGSGSGSVTSSPAGIDCGSTCSHGYAHGTSVTLTATPSSGSSFGGWSGDCSGSGSCTLAMSANRAVTATFPAPTSPPSVKCIVPKVKGKTLAAAKKAIVKGKCRVGAIRRAYSSRMKKGRVISQKPAPGKRLPKGAKVNLVVSKGKK